MSKKVLIVGSGLAGLAAALRLSRRGYEVELVEKNDQAGGRLNQLKKDGFTFDVGPSFSFRNWPKSLKTWSPISKKKSKNT